MPTRRDKFGKKIKRISKRKEGKISSVYEYRFRHAYYDSTAQDVYIPAEFTKTVHNLRRSPIDVQYIRDLIEVCGTQDPQVLAMSKANHLYWTLAKITRLVRDVQKIDNPEEIDCNELIFRGCVAIPAKPQEYEVMDIEIARRLAQLKKEVK